jgi:hypothetical protein
MTELTTPEAIVQRQLDAYNAKDIEAWLATYAPDARQFEHPGKLLASSRVEIRVRMGIASPIPTCMHGCSSA